MQRKTILLLAAGGMLGMVIGLVIFFQFNRVDPSTAAVSTFLVVDEAPVTEMTLDAPVLRQLPVIGPNTRLERPVKTAVATPQKQTY